MKKTKGQKQHFVQQMEKSHFTKIEQRQQIAFHFRLSKYEFLISWIIAQMDLDQRELLMNQAIITKLMEKISEDDLKEFKKFKYYTNKNNWQIQFASSFIVQLLASRYYADQAEQIINNLVEGKFYSNSKLIEIKIFHDLEFLQSYILAVGPNSTILFETGVLEIPCINHITQKIYAFKYENCIRFLEIKLPYNLWNNYPNIITKYYSASPFKNYTYKPEISPEILKKNNFSQHLFIIDREQTGELTAKLNLLSFGNLTEILPFTFTKQFIESNNTQQLKPQQLHQINIEKPLKLKSMKIIKNMQNLQYIQSRLQKVAKIDLKINKEQNEFLKSCGRNTLLTGRSGTGKSISALIWAIQNIGIQANIQSAPMKYIFVSSNNEQKDRLHKIYNQVIQNQIPQKQNLTNQYQENPDHLSLRELYNEMNCQEQQQQIDNQSNLIQQGISFFSFRDFIFKIDGQLTTPFFSHFNGQNQYYKTNKNNHQYPREVDFDLFQNDFWPKNYQNIKYYTNVSIHYVWSYLFSQIKGNYQEHKITPQICFQSRNLDQLDKYSSFTLRNSLHSIIYYYEQWKFGNGYYDLLDVISYLIGQIETCQYQQLPIDYLIVDDVQELPNSILYLCQLISKKQLLMIGDSANITDASVLLANDSFSKLVQLNLIQPDNIFWFQINHRLSNKNLIKVANSILKILNSIQSETIIHMIDLKNHEEGLKPIILKENEIQSIIELGFVNNTNNPNLDFVFGYDTVIIVRNQQQRDEINNLLRYFQILTIQEAQGLEFNQVILVNLFQDYQNAWRIMETIDLQQNDKQHKQPYYSDLISLLRQLYSIVTRCKQQLIIYDDKDHNRKFIQQIWEKEGLIQFYQPSQPQMKNEQILQKWHEIGQIMMKQKYFSEASHCFKNSGSIAKEHEALLYLELNQCRQLDEKIQKLKYNLNQSQKKLKKLLIQQKEAALLNLGQQFENANLKLKAAQCYYQASEFEKALQLFISLDMKNEAAKISMVLEYYQQASQFYQEIKDIKSARFALEKAKDYETLLELLRKQQFSITERKEYLYKYFPMFLNSLLQQIDQQDQKGQEYKKQNQNQVIIEDIYEENENSQDSCELTFQKLDCLKNSKINYEESNESEEFSVQNSQQSEDQTQQRNITESFSILQKCNSSQLEKFEHLSNYDPDDQWLMQSDNRSIVESIISKQSDSSDFSAFSYAQIQTNPQMQLVTTKANIYVQDTIMQKIIKNVKLFEQEFEELLQNQERNQQLGDQFNVEMMLELDCVDHQFINLILDVLEQFKCFKLCIFVCNRYKFADLLGKYLVSIGANYSPICVESTLITNKNYQILQYGTKRQHQIDKTIIASYAVHSVLEILNPEYQRLKYENEPLNMLNSLGLLCYQEMIILGLWKKILYQLDISNAIQVCEIYLDFKNWKFIYFTNRIHKLEQELSQKENNIKLQGELMICQKKLKQCFDNQTIFEVLYFSQPIFNHQIELTLVCLEQFYFTLTYQLVLNNIVDSRVFFYKGTMDTKIYKIDLLKLQYPTFLSLTSVFVYQVFTQQDITLQLIQDIISDFNLPERDRINQIKIFQSSILLYLTLILSLWGRDNQNILAKLSLDEVFYKVKSCISIFQRKHNLQSQLRRRIYLLLYKTREIKTQSLFQFYKTKLFVHRSSVIVRYIVSGGQIQNQLIQGYLQDADFEFIIVDEIIGQRFIQNQFNYLLSQLAIQRNKLIINQMELKGNVDFKDLSKILTTDFIGYELAKEECLKVKKKSTKISQTHSLTDLYLKFEQESAKLKEKEKYEMLYLDQVEQKNLKLTYSDKVKIYKKEFYRNLIICQQRVENTVKEYLIKIGSNFLEESIYIQNDMKKHKKIIKGILIFDHLHLSHYALGFLEKNKLKSYNYFVEYLVCRSDQIYTDAFLCYNQYLTYKKQLMFQEEISFSLISLFLNQFIQLKFSFSNEGTLIVNEAYRKYFPESDGNILSYNSQIIKDPAIMIDTLDCLINHSIDNQHIINLVIFSLINQEEQQEVWLKKLKEIVNQIRQQNSNCKLLQLIEELINERSLILRQQLIEQYQEYLSSQWINLNYVNKLKTQEQQEMHYNNSLACWEGYSSFNKILRRYVNLIWNRYQQSNLVIVNENRNRVKLIYDKLVQQLKQIQSIYFNTQFNHPRPFHEIAILANRLLEKLQIQQMQTEEVEIDQFIEFQKQELNKWQTLYQAILSMEKRNEINIQKWANLQLKFSTKY